MMAKRKPRASLVPKPVTPAYLRGVAVRYLAERMATRAMVAAVLERRSLRRLQVRRLDDVTRALIDSTLESLADLSLLDDQGFAKVKAASLGRKGLPRRRIVAGLERSGVGSPLIAEALPADLDDLAQARLFARRKRLGPWSRASASGEAQRQRDLRVLARAGFAYAVAARALEPCEEE